MTKYTLQDRESLAEIQLLKGTAEKWDNEYYNITEYGINQFTDGYAFPYSEYLSMLTNKNHYKTMYSYIPDNAEFYDYVDDVMWFEITES